MKYCYKCGAELTQKECFNCGISDGIFPYCESCGEFRFPFFNVAVSSVIFNKDYSKILLIQQYGRPFNILVAGYVNKTETLEHALVREIQEEVNLKVKDFKFNESSYFEKSNSLICNFIVCVENENFELTQEVDSAHWFTLQNAIKEVKESSLAEYFLNKAVKKLNLLKQ